MGACAQRDGRAIARGRRATPRRCVRRGAHSLHLDSVEALVCVAEHVLQSIIFVRSKSTGTPANAGTGGWHSRLRSDHARWEDRHWLRWALAHRWATTEACAGVSETSHPRQSCSLLCRQDHFLNTAMLTDRQWIRDRSPRLAPALRTDRVLADQIEVTLPGANGYLVLIDLGTSEVPLK